MMTIQAATHWASQAESFLGSNPFGLHVDRFGRVRDEHDSLLDLCYAREDVAGEGWGE